MGAVALSLGTHVAADEAAFGGEAVANSGSSMYLMNRGLRVDGRFAPDRSLVPRQRLQTALYVRVSV